MPPAVSAKTTGNASTDATPSRSGRHGLPDASGGMSWCVTSVSMVDLLPPQRYDRRAAPGVGCDPGDARTVVSVFSVRSRAIGSVFDELVAFFRPTYAHVREEKQRLDLMREEEGDAAPGCASGRPRSGCRVPEGYQAPSGPRRPTEEPPDSRGIVV